MYRGKIRFHLWWLPESIVKEPALHQPNSSRVRTGHRRQNSFGRRLQEDRAAVGRLPDDKHRTVNEIDGRVRMRQNEERERERERVCLCTLHGYADARAWYAHVEFCLSMEAVDDITRDHQRDGCGVFDTFHCTCHSCRRGPFPTPAPVGQ